MVRVLIVAAFAMMAIRCNSILGIERLHGRPDGGASRGQVDGDAGLATGSGGGAGAPGGSTGGTAGGGTGGSTVSGSGGTSVTGAGGSRGSGGTPGAGGTTGTGGAQGIGGATGTGGAPTLDAGPVDCTLVATNYFNAVRVATHCGNGLTCDQLRPKTLSCSGGCMTFISIVTNADKYAAQWMAGNCAAKVSPCTGTDLCAAPPSGSTCIAVGFTNEGDCKDDP